MKTKFYTIGPYKVNSVLLEGKSRGIFSVFILSALPIIILEEAISRAIVPNNEILRNQSLLSLKSPNPTLKEEKLEF